MRNNSIPVNDLKRFAESDQGLAICDVASAVLKTGWWLNGKETSSFCTEFAAYIGTPHCLAVANGTDALEIAMRALVGPDLATKDKEVITVGNAGGYSAFCCHLLGLTPAYADIVEASQLMSIPSAISLLSNKTTFVVATHLYGGVVDVEALRAAMDAAGYAKVPILEDCAQAHGAKLRGKTVGSLGDVATFSFYPTKNLGAFGDGGAITTRDAGLFDLCKRLHQYGWSSKYCVDTPMGRNSRMDEVQAAILRAKLKSLDVETARRVDILDRYQAALGGNITLVRSAEGTVGHLAILLCDDRDSLAKHLEAQGIKTDIHYPVLDFHQKAWRDLPHRKAQDLSVSDLSKDRILTVPLFPMLTDVEVDRICDALSNWQG